MNNKIKHDETAQPELGTLTDAQKTEIRHAATVLAFYAEIELTYVQLDLENPGWFEGKFRGSVNIVMRRLAKAGVLDASLKSLRIFKQGLWVRYPTQRFMYTFDID